ncbi:MAG TPA: GWxTD domain-containing protein [Gemmatimonadales bacterium]
MKGAYPTLLALALAAAPAARGAAQASSSDSAAALARRMVQDAIGFAERGDTAQAIARAAQAARLAPDLADAHFLYGLLLARTSRANLGSWGRRAEASSEFEAALRLDRGNPRYLIEVARLRLKAPILRLQAERLFRRALDAARKRKDPALEAEVEAEIGNIYFRRYDAMAHRRVVVGALQQSFDWGAAMRDPHYTKDMLLDLTVPLPESGETDLANAEEHFRAGVRADSGSVAANTALLAMLAATDRDEELLDAAHTFVAAAASSADAWLALGLAQWRLHHGAAADSSFQHGLALLSPTEREPLEDLSAVLRAPDALGYRQLSESARIAFDSTYWWAAEPLRLTPENEFRLEHLARVAYADLLFSAPDLRLKGWQTDRGQLLVRYGPPPIVGTFPPDPQENGDDLLQIGMITTVWYYPEGNLRFVFFGPPAYNYQRLAGDFPSYAENLRSQVPSVYNNVPVAQNMDSILVQPAAFLPAVDSSGTDLLFFAGIPVHEMVSGVDLRQGRLETGLFVSDGARRDVVVRRHTEGVTFGAADQFENRTYEARLSPGSYYYRFEALLPDVTRAARGSALLSVDDFHADTLSMSDVLVANRIAPKEDGGPLRGRQDFFIAPNAAMRFHRTDPVHLYAEVYHLRPKPGSEGVAEFEVALRLRVDTIQRQSVAARVVGGLLDAVGASAKGDNQVLLSFVSREPIGGRDRIPIYLALDMGGAPAGVYSLDMSVKDLTTGRIAARHRTVTITEGPR